MWAKYGLQIFPEVVLAKLSMRESYFCLDICDFSFFIIVPTYDKSMWAKYGMQIFPEVVLAKLSMRESYFFLGIFVMLFYGRNFNFDIIFFILRSGIVVGFVNWLIPFGFEAKRSSSSFMRYLIFALAASCTATSSITGLLPRFLARSNSAKTCAVNFDANESVFWLLSMFLHSSTFRLDFKDSWC